MKPGRKPVKKIIVVNQEEIRQRVQDFFLAQYSKKENLLDALDGLKKFPKLNEMGPRDFRRVAYENNLFEQVGKKYNVLAVVTYFDSNLFILWASAALENVNTEEEHVDHPDPQLTY